MTKWQMSNSGVTVRTILDSGCLGKADLLTGEAGLDRRVSGITVVSTPDPYDFLRGNELCLTTGYALDKSDSALSDTIARLSEKKVSALAFKEGRYMPKIDENAMDLAQKYSFPIIRLPKDIMWQGIFESVFSLLFQANDVSALPFTKASEFRAADAFANYMLDGHHSIDSLFKQAGFLGVQVFPAYLLFVFRLSDPWLSHQVLECVRSQISVYGCGLVLREGFICIMCPLTEASLTGTEITKMATSVSSALEKNGFSTFLPVAYPKSPIPITRIFGAYRQARAVLHLSLSAGTADKGLVAYEDGGILGTIISSIDPDEIRRYYTGKIGALVEHDCINNSGLLETMETYLDMDCSIQKAAKKLFIHPSTLKHRLRRADDILETTNKTFEGRTESYMALKLWRLSGSPKPSQKPAKESQNPQ